LILLAIIISCNSKKTDKNIAKSDSVTQSRTDTTVRAQPNPDPFTDLTKRYRFSYEPWADSGSVAPDDLRIAIIPKDSIGEIKIPWHGLKTDFSVVSEKQFELEMMKCIEGRDKNTENGQTKTTKLESFCERTGYSDWGGMESYPLMYYAGFMKGNYLVIAELFTSWYKCDKQPTKKEQDDCNAENDKQRASIRAFIDNLVKSINITEIPGH
jgi:hypothetical protein